MEHAAWNVRMHPELAAQLRPAIGETLEAIDQTLGQFAKDSATILQPAEAGAAKVRNALIAHLREADAGEERDAVQKVLEQINICISLILGVAYPQGDPKKETLEEAREIVKRLEQSLAS